MQNILQIEIGNTTAVMIFIVLLALSVVGLYYLAKNVLKTEKRYAEEKSILVEGALSRSGINSYVSSYITKIGKDVSFSMIYIDLDNFADIDNTFGTKETNKILERITKRMVGIVPKNVKVSRYESDTYLIFIPLDYDKMQALNYARKLNEAITESIDLFGETNLNITASVALCYYPIHGNNIKQMLNSLKLAIYTVKKNGGNAIRIYSDDMSRADGEFLEYYYQIKKAIERKEFLLYYHPIMDLETNKIYGAEALLRWEHPEHGLLSPYKFINIMEQSGDIYWVGLWGLETLIKSYYQLKQAYPDEDIKLSFNISPKQLMVESIANDFQKLLRKYKMNASNIILELAEYALFEKHKTVLESIQKLKQIGFKIAIDGFGLDYATLTRLEEAPI
ncbi:MAG TPA: EAL domain-containing protein, partial [Acholeplasma sp.]|nr:EAL domain-containing protein [Acholeplasma sp.]